MHAKIKAKKRDFKPVLLLFKSLPKPIKAVSFNVDWTSVRFAIFKYFNGIQRGEKKTYQYVHCGEKKHILSKYEHWK